MESENEAPAAFNAEGGNGNPNVTTATGEANHDRSTADDEAIAKIVAEDAFLEAEQQRFQSQHDETLARMMEDEEYDKDRRRRLQHQDGTRRRLKWFLALSALLLIGIGICAFVSARSIIETRNREALPSLTPSQVDYYYPDDIADTTTTMYPTRV